MTAVLVSAKVYVFYSKFNKTFPKSSERFYLAQTLIKHKKHNQNRSRSKKQGIKKIGLPPNKRYRLTPLARHNKQG